MYKLTLILKYLRKRRIAWVSLIAVTLCTAMVLVVISVMGGWLRMFEESFHGLGGDIAVYGELHGFPHYEEMIERIEQLPDVKAAVPVIDTFGLINIHDRVRQGVRVVGYPIERVGLVNGFPRSLYRQYQEQIDLAENDKLPRDQRQAARKLAEHGAANPSWDKPLPETAYKFISGNARNAEKWPGMIVGVGVARIRKNRDGTWPDRDGIYERWARLTVLGISGEGASMVDVQQKSEDPYWIVDTSRTQIWQYDQNSVYVPFANLQRSLSMDKRDEIDADTNEVRVVPGRTQQLQISAKPGADLNVVRDAVEQVVMEVSANHGTADRYPTRVETWRESQATYLAAIQKEKLLVTFLFGIISIVAIFLIFCIFYMIVAEKTKDIGIIKSVGATNAGVAGIFLGYGLAIGVVGSGLGFLAGFLIVRNINYLHTKMGQLLNIEIWNPEVYAFDTIPNTMDPREVSVILAVALVSAVLGAVVPAIRAAKMQPVEALRWE